MVRFYLFLFRMVIFQCLIETCRTTTEYETYFHIFTKENPDKPISVSWLDKTEWSKHKSLENCAIKLIAHGYAERWNMDWRWDWVNEMKNEILKNKKNENFCVIAIDWERGAREINFITAVANADVSGEHLAEFIQSNRINPKRLHCIGFSLGAHLCAFASNNFYVMTNNTLKFARITGLDPSGPLLRKASIEKRLSPDDADFVDCIHTSTTFGLQEKSGHMDFFPDGGQSSAKGCEKLIKIKDENDESQISRFSKRFFISDSNENNEQTNLPRKNFIERLRDRIGQLNPLKKIFLNIHAYIGCNHLRSPNYFISSINHCEFRAKLCSTWSNYLDNKCPDPINNNKTYPRMGFYADRSDRFYREGNENFYLKTTSEKPYCSPSDNPTSKTKKKVSMKSKIKKKLSKYIG